MSVFISYNKKPIVLNILFGHMSLIGPRPHLTKNYKGYDLLDEPHKKRLEVRPGVTGYSQAYFRNSITSDKKLENDVYYVEHLSLWLDIKILFKTAFSVLKRENIYVSDEIKTAEAKAGEEAKEESKEPVAK